MKRLLGSFVVAACLTTSASLANAATVTDLGALSPTAFGNWGFNVTTNGSIDQIYEFSIAAPTLITISESNSGPGTLTNGILDLFSGTPPASSPALTSAAIGPANQPAQSALIGNPKGFSLTAGSYFFEVTGTLSGLPADRTEPFSGTYSLSPDLAPGVPEPATFALMSLGLLTVGFASYRRRRSQGLSIRFI